MCTTMSVGRRHRGTTIHDYTLNGALCHMSSCCLCTTVLAQNMCTCDMITYFIVFSDYILLISFELRVCMRRAIH